MFFTQNFGSHIRKIKFCCLPLKRGRQGDAFVRFSIDRIDSWPSWQINQLAAYQTNNLATDSLLNWQLNPIGRFTIVSLTNSQLTMTV
jgi:hypothetical protein